MPMDPFQTFACWPPKRVAGRLTPIVGTLGKSVASAVQLAVKDEVLEVAGISIEVMVLDDGSITITTVSGGMVQNGLLEYLETMTP